MNQMHKVLFMLIAMAAIMLAAVGLNKAYLGYNSQRWKEERYSRYENVQAEAEEIKVIITELSQDEEAIRHFLAENMEAFEEDINIKGGITGAIADDLADHFIDDSNLWGDGLSDDDLSGNRLSEGSISDNRLADSGISGNRLTDNDISDNRIADSGVSGNWLTGNDISDNRIAGSSISDNSLSRHGLTGNGTDAEGTQAGSVSANGISGNGMADGGISANDLSAGSVSDNYMFFTGASGNSVSGNGVSGNGVSGNGIADDNQAEEILARIRSGKLTLSERRKLQGSYMETIAVNQADKKVIASNMTDFSNMKIACLGDSITAATNLESRENYLQYSYPSKLKEILGAAEAVNLGIGGSSVGRYWDNAFVDRYQKIPADTDIIIVMGGTNDGFCVTADDIGDMTERAPDTFVGDLDQLMRGLKENYPDALIIFATPLPNVLHDILRKDRDYLLPQENLVNIINRLGVEYELPVIDLYNSNILDSHDAANIYNFLPDGVHCNPAGYQILAEHFGAEIIKIYESDNV